MGTFEAREGVYDSMEDECWCCWTVVFWVEMFGDVWGVLVVSWWTGARPSLVVLFLQLFECLKGIYDIWNFVIEKEASDVTEHVWAPVYAQELVVFPYTELSSDIFHRHRTEQSDKWQIQMHSAGGTVLLTIPFYVRSSASSMAAIISVHEGQFQNASMGMILSVYIIISSSCCEQISISLRHSDDQILHNDTPNYSLSPWVYLQLRSYARVWDTGIIGPPD